MKQRKENREHVKTKKYITSRKRIAIVIGILILGIVCVVIYSNWQNIMGFLNKNKIVGTWENDEYGTMIFTDDGKFFLHTFKFDIEGEYRITGCDEANRTIYTNGTLYFVQFSDLQSLYDLQEIGIQCSSWLTSFVMEEDTLISSDFLKFYNDDEVVLNKIYQ